MWRRNNLSEATSGAVPEPAGRPFGYAFETNDSQHIVYVSADNNIQELYWREGRGWRTNTLTLAPEGGSPLSMNNPMGYGFRSDNSQHVIFRGSDNHVHELYWKPAHGWRHNNLSIAAGQRSLFATGRASGYAFEGDDSQHVVFRGEDGHIHEFYWKASFGWRHNDLTLATNPDAPVTSGDPRGYAFESDDSQHVFFPDSNGHVHELY